MKRNMKLTYNKESKVAVPKKKESKVRKRPKEEGYVPTWALNFRPNLAAKTSNNKVVPNLFQSPTTLIFF